MRRKLVLTGALVVLTLTLVPTVLAAVRGATLTTTPFRNGGLELRGWRTSAPLDAANLRPGVAVRESFRFADDSGEAARFVLLARNHGDRRLEASLRVVLTRRSTGRVLYAGPLTDLDEVAVGRVAPHSTADVDVTVTVAAPADRSVDELQARRTAVAFAWTATAA